jgi:hypothetical protein
MNVLKSQQDCDLYPIYDYKSIYRPSAAGQAFFSVVGHFCMIQIDFSVVNYHFSFIVMLFRSQFDLSE